MNSWLRKDNVSGVTRVGNKILELLPSLICKEARKYSMLYYPSVGGGTIWFHKYL